MTELENIKNRFERILEFDHFRLNVSARYRLRSKIHGGGDVVVVIKIEPKESDNPLCEAILLGEEQALDDFFQVLREEYDQSEKRMVFVSVFSQSFQNGPLFMGRNDLHPEKSKDKKENQYAENDVESIANKTMQSLAAILQSYQSLKVEEAAIEFRITILSKDHVKKLEGKLRKKKQNLPKNILRTNSEDETDL